MTNSQKNALFKAGVLAEALPWLLKFQDSIVVIKFGGNAMVNKDLLTQFAQDVVFLKLAGLKPVVVHGAGPQITEALSQANIKSEFKNGLRVTNSESIKIIKKVLVQVCCQSLTKCCRICNAWLIGRKQTLKRFCLLLAQSAQSQPQFWQSILQWRQTRLR